MSPTGPSANPYIDRARVLVDLAVHASCEEARSEFALLAALYQELAQRRVRLSSTEDLHRDLQCSVRLGAAAERH